VALARAIVMHPQLLLADEPTGNLDSKTGESVMDLFFKLNHQFHTTMLIVTHNPELAVRMTRVLKMVDGRLEDVTHAPGGNATMLHHPSAAEQHPQAASNHTLEQNKTEEQWRSNPREEA
jgi:ABC-type lipoprotein export system ATPase subunit